MSDYKSDFLNIMQERGFIHQGSDLEGLDEKLSKGPVTGYVGYDPTGASLHIGHLYTIMMLHWFQKCGNRPITLMGGGTALIPDPTLKDKTRPLLQLADINSNIASIQKVFSKFINYGDTTKASILHNANSGNKKNLITSQSIEVSPNKQAASHGNTSPQSGIMENNYSWLSSLSYIEMLRDVGMHFTVNRMLTFDSVKSRLERELPMTFIEFNYMIFQAIDFVELYHKYDCILQLGGSDQWGNMINGVELGRKKDGLELYALTAPLLTTASGAKMGKTEGGAIWLNEDLTSPYEYFQYWRNVEDADVPQLLRVFTTLPMEEVHKLEALQGQDINEAKKILAFEATKLLHGEAAANEAQKTAEKVFEQGSVGEDLPSITVEAARLKAGIPILDLLVEAGLAGSKGEARRLIKGGGAKLNDNKIESDSMTIDNSALPQGADHAKLSMGKKKHVLVKAK